MAKLEFLTWLRIGSGMLQVHKELGSLRLSIVSFPLHFPGSFFRLRTTLNSSMTSPRAEHSHHPLIQGLLLVPFISLAEFVFRLSSVIFLFMDPRYRASGWTG
jgi:hypothetical protein